MANLIQTRSSTARPLIRLGLIAGLAGGAAEVAWIVLFSQVAGGSGAVVADGVTATLVPGLAGTPGSVALGLIIHFALAAALGLAVAVALRSLLPRLAGSWTEAGLVLATLAAVWAVNFYLILPVLNPAFVHIVPLPASLASKLLFGVAVVLIFRMHSDGNDQKTEQG